VLSCGAALATGLYEEGRRSRVLGAYTMIWAVGGTIGPLLGGALVAAWDWPAVFWFRVPMAAAALVLFRGRDRSHRTEAKETFDLAGAALLVLGLAALLLTINRIGEFAAVPLGFLSAGAFCGFVWQEARCEKPIIDLKVFRLPRFAVLNAAGMLTNLAGFAIWLLVPFYLVRSGLSVAEGGAVLATASAGAIAASPAGGRLIGRISAQGLVLAATMVVSAGLALVATWNQGTPTAWLVIALLVQGIGIGLFQTAYTDIVAATIPREHRGVAGSLAMVTRTVGTVTAAAIVMVVFRHLEQAADFLTAFRQTFALAAILALAMAVLLWRRGA
jgi:MFS family permease